ncbi:cation-translocating P-type ATPase [Acaryochloris marina]|uniref:Calcium-transporting ATPase, putative n=1 Tax=Acaryochloris marina (strain MBIC 11017) TaxID=329726 RepID=B0BZR7_ACAM1|nr:cation-translocating P-type ATPase [Acaryochloris marina]ABW25993.1 calcium-transporting ATPase, putative [Acaryochloris marina MBIC11017]BDM80841.1 ATPase [Acaryochloris marina MBIC10699]
MEWYQLHPEDVLHHLDTSLDQGLSQTEVTNRQQTHGLNELIEQDRESPWQMLWKQLTATMVLILIVAAVLSGLLGDIKDALAIFAIVIFNAGLGFFQDYQAEQAIAALKKLAVPSVRVRRQNSWQEVGAQSLVPGDIIAIEAGNLVPADCRVVDSASLRIQEASLTGESEPVDKIRDALGNQCPLAERHNMVYMGTAVTYGRGQAVVIDTGMKTELGQIAAAIQTAKPSPTLLQQRLDQFGQQLAIAITILILIIFLIGLLQGENLRFMFLTAVSLGVAAVPEGLPAIVTIALALGAQRMLKHQALIRKLPAVETLGSVTVICSDKTGTLTENRMTVTDLVFADTEITLPTAAIPLTPEHPPHPCVQHLQPHQQSALDVMLTGLALCNDACLELDPEHPDHYRLLGDPTETALLTVSAQLGPWPPQFRQDLPRHQELPFDANRKLMSTVHPFKAMPCLEALAQQAPAPLSSLNLMFTKGALDRLLDLSSHIWSADRIEPLSETKRHEIFQIHDRLAAEGKRILGIALRWLPQSSNGLSPQNLEQDLVLMGLVAMIDPPRPEAKDAVFLCQTAGIRPVMITGDHPITANAIAQQLKISSRPPLTGQDLTQLNEAQLSESVQQVSIYARVSPQHKLAIVRTLQQQGQIVAMTGDGINDAPALKQADIGVAMGITGTDVAKQAADMILLNDDFSTIVAAVREGRVIYDNIRKFIKYTLSGNCGELWVILMAPLVGMPIPLLPLQILWINLLADGLLAIGLSVEPAERNIMRRSPYSPTENLFSRGVGRDIAWIGLWLGCLFLGVGYWGWQLDLAQWQTFIFTTLAFSRIFLVQAIRGEQESFFKMGVLSNKPLLGSVILTTGLQLLVLYNPMFQKIFETQPLSVVELLLCLGVASLGFLAVELQKWGLRQKKR